jgi:hypothetical protein
MQYRKFGDQDFQASVLGFGVMRLPIIDDDNGRIDEQKATRLIRTAIDRGVNYVDTGYLYHGGKSELFVGRALGDGYRDRVKLSTKMPPYDLKRKSDLDRLLNEQLDRLQTEHIDFYQLHGLDPKYWKMFQSLDVFDWAEKAILDGRIGQLGFSFHAEYELFEEIVDAYDKWTFCLIQLNFMDVEFQAGLKGLRYATDKGLSVAIMEPLRGGQLTQKPPKEIESLWKSAPIQRSPAEWALRWLWNQPEVKLVLSGMSTLQQLEENLNTADSAKAGSLSEEELTLIDRAREAYAEISPIPCTNCGYCMPCPNGVNISRILGLYNDCFMYGDSKTPRFFYRGPLRDQQATLCDKCLECEEKCPQNISIAEWLEKAHLWLGPKS